LVLRGAPHFWLPFACHSRVAAGIATTRSTISVFSTTVVLVMEANSNLSRAEAAPRVGKAFGIPVDNVHGEDWLSIMVSTKETGSRRISARDIAERAIGTIVSAEQIAAYVGGKNRTLSIAAANAFLLELEAKAAGNPFAQLQAVPWLEETAVAILGKLAPSAAATGAPDVANTAAMVSRQIVAAKDLGNDGDTVEVLEAWAKIAHVAEGWFAGNASLLRVGEITPEEYRCAFHLAKLRLLPKMPVWVLPNTSMNNLARFLLRMPLQIPVVFRITYRQTYWRASYFKFSVES
jgi:hypothetical protein